MCCSSFVGVRREEWIAMAGFVIIAVWSRYQNHVDPGWIVMAWRMAGMRDQVEGAPLRVYWSLLGKKVL
jgi:hypothetical protein